MTYSKESVLQAAQVAYSSTLAGNDEDYVTSKSRMFLHRCLQFDGDIDADYVSQDAIDEICYAALDADTERIFKSALQEFSF